MLEGMNIEQMRQHILNGPNKHPGANYVVRLDGRKLRVYDENKEVIAENLNLDML